MKTFKEFINEAESSYTHSEFIGAMFSCRDTAHLIHLESKTMSEHKTLQEFYEKLLELIDKFSEAFMGGNDINKINAVVPQSMVQPVETLLEFYNSHIEKVRVITDATDLNAILDEFKELGNTIDYKIDLK